MRQAASLLQRVQASPYIPQKPYAGDAARDHPRQAAFLVAPQKEVLYGGAAGGGKSSALLMGALLFADEPDYAALLLRRTYADLSLPGALMERAEGWLRGTDAHWNGNEKTWTFPSGATLTFGYLEAEKDKYRYQGSEFHFIGFDELTQFTESMYRYLFSRLRRQDGSRVPIRMRAGSNPGGIGHEWVHQRFMVERKDDRLFIPAKLDDNPHLDQAEYEQALAELDPVTYEQLRHGSWSARAAGGWFKAAKAQIVDVAPALITQVRWWDMAASEAKAGMDPDWTVGARLGRDADGFVYVLDVVRVRAAPAETEDRIRQTAQLDGRRVPIWMEQEPGSSGVIATDYYRRKVLPGYIFDAERATGDKVSRARPWASAMNGGLVRLVRGAWNRPFLEEHEAFPQAGVHDDQVDAASGAFAKLGVGVGEAFTAAWERMAAEARAARNGHAA